MRIQYGPACIKAALLISALASGVVYASSSANYEIAATVLEAAGGGSISADYSHVTAVGQSGEAQSSSSAAYASQSGFLPALPEGELTDTPHSADTNDNWAISATEIGRVVGFYNAGGYCVNATTLDGYAPGTGSHEGDPHDSDYSPQNWAISATELSRLVTFYNAGGYLRDATTLDGFKPDLSK